jgi:hypothetical protein
VKAVLDSIENNEDFEVTKHFIVGDIIQPFQRYASLHYAESADAAILNAMIADGYLKRRPRPDKNNTSCPH